MPLDPAQWVGDWNTNSSLNQPQGSDTRREGDNQIRDAKKVIKDSFPNILGAVDPTHTQLNTLSDIATAQTVETRLTTLEDNSAKFPSGTYILFYQAAAPAGWTQLTIGSDSLVRFVPGIGQGFGGTDNPILNDKVSAHSHPFTSDSDGTHTHDLAQHTGDVGGTTALDQGIFGAGRQDIAASGYVKADGAHTHTGTTNTNTSASNWEPRYIDVIAAAKD